MSKPRLILASSSPRRRQLLQDAGYEFLADPPGDGAEDGPRPSESPADFVVRLAKQKAGDVARSHSEGLILGCDTVAVCEGQILGKPRDRDDARAMLKQMSGQRHWVYSGVCIWRRPDNQGVVALDQTELEMSPLDSKLLESYLDSRGWEGKAGAFGFQDGLDWVRIVDGSPSNVVGLPMELLERMLVDLNEGRGLSELSV